MTRPYRRLNLNWDNPEEVRAYFKATEDKYKGRYTEKRNQYYAKLKMNKPPMIRKGNKKDKIKAFVLDYKQTHNCVTCGQKFPHYVMDFHHREPLDKSFGIAEAYCSSKNKGKYNIDLVVDEMAKCDLLCANCHRIRTHEERHNYKIPINKEIAATIDMPQLGLVFGETIQ
jgi:hypothetical protein